MTVGHVMSDPRTTQIEYMLLSLVSVFSNSHRICLSLLYACCRGGTSDSSVIKPRRSTGVCYAYNGESTPNVWTNVNHCRGKDKCKFQHKCMICAGDHAVYENKDCAAQTRARTPLPRHK